MQDTVQEVSLDSKIDQELVKNNVTEAVIGALKQKYGELRLKSIDDKESYLEIKEAAKECAKVRNLAKKVCVAGREDAVKIQKLWVAKEKSVIALIAEVEDPLDAEIKRFDDEIERKKQEEIRRKEEIYINRTQDITKMGALFGDNHFALGDFSIEAQLVKECDEEVWVLELLPKFREQYEKIEAERLEQERIKKEQEEKNRQEREELLQKQREFEAQQAEFKRQQEEAAQKAKEEQLRQEKAALEVRQKLFTARSAVLSGMGMTFNGVDFYFDDIKISNEQIVTLDENEWVELVTTTKPKVADKIAEKARIAAEKAAEIERARIVEEQRLAEIRKQQEDAKKAEELAKAGDKANWLHLIEQVKNITVPSFKSGQYKKAAAIVLEKLEEIKSLM